MSRRSGKKASGRTNRAIVSFESQDNIETRPNNDDGTIVHTHDNDDNRIDNLTETETKVLIAKCVRFILSENSKFLIKQVNINRNLSENFNIARSQQNKLMKMVMKRLWEDFGLILIEVEDLPKSYILHTIYSNDLLTLKSIDNNESFNYDNSFDQNIMPCNINFNYEEFPSENKDITYEEILDKSKFALLLIILSFILMKDDAKISETELFKLIENVGIDITSTFETGRDGNTFKQNIQDLISKELVRSNYLKRIKQTQTDLTTNDYYYEFGIRSKFEFKSNNIVDFITNIIEIDEINLKVLREKANKFDENRDKIILNTIKLITGDNINNIDNNNNDNDNGNDNNNDDAVMVDVENQSTSINQSRSLIDDQQENSIMETLEQVQVQESSTSSKRGRQQTKRKN